MRSLVGTVSNTRMDEFGSEGPAKKAEGGGGGRGGGVGVRLAICTT